LIRAGYSLANREWWEVQTAKNEDANIISEQNLNINSEQSSLLNNNSERVFREENESRRSLGLAYQTSDRFIVSADYIENNNLNIFDDQNIIFQLDHHLLFPVQIFQINYHHLFERLL
jgi:hypothetical protein